MKINLSANEWKLMNFLWEKAPLTITELTALMKKGSGWSKNTIITMLSRLENKGAVRYESGKRAREYFPAVLKSDAAQAETENFLDKVFGGSLGLMVNAMVQSRALSKPELEELLQILEKARDGQS
jgi:BlaI family penicillinase repressor